MGEVGKIKVIMEEEIAFRGHLGFINLCVLYFIIHY